MNSIYRIINHNKNDSPIDNSVACNSNPSKSASLLLRRKYNRLYRLEISVNQQSITEVNSHKSLGVTVNGEWSGHKYLAELKSEAWQQISKMRKLKFILDKQSRQPLYFSFTGPFFEYAVSFFFFFLIIVPSMRQTDSKTIQMKAATRATRLVSINSLRRETGWETLASKR